MSLLDFQSDSGGNTDRHGHCQRAVHRDLSFEPVLHHSPKGSSLDGTAEPAVVLLQFVTVTERKVRVRYAQDGAALRPVASRVADQRSRHRALSTGLVRQITHRVLVQLMSQGCKREGLI